MGYPAIIWAHRTVDLLWIAAKLREAAEYVEAATYQGSSEGDRVFLRAAKCAAESALAHGRMKEVNADA